MKLATPLTKDRVCHHFTYHWWKYALIAVLSVFLWDLVYVQTAYRSPENKRIDIYVQSVATTAEQVDAFMLPVWQNSVPDMETVSSVMLMPVGNESYYANIQLTTFLTARQGDLYLLSSDSFKSFAAQGAFVPLEGFLADGTLRIENADIKSGYVVYRETDMDADGKSVVHTENHLYGLPIRALPGFRPLLGDGGDSMYICVAVGNGNDDNVLAFLDALVAYTSGGPAAPDA